MKNDIEIEVELSKILRKYQIEDMRIELTNTNGSMWTRNWQTEVKSTLKQELLELIERAQHQPIEWDEEYIKKVQQEEAGSTGNDRS